LQAQNRRNIKKDEKPLESYEIFLSVKYLSTLLIKEKKKQVAKKLKQLNWEIYELKEGGGFVLKEFS